MTVTIKSDVVLSERVFLAGASGKLTRQNDRTANQGGFPTVNGVRDVTIDQYSFGSKPMKIEFWSEIEGAYEDTDAGVFGFLITDPKDHFVTVANGALQGYMAGVQFGTPGFGNGTPNYVLGQLKKPKSTTRTRFRARTRPNGTPSIFRAGSPVTIGSGAGNAGLSAGPVFVTFVADSSSNVSSITPGATTSVTLAAALPGLAVGGKLWLQDLTGADAALVNNLSHTVTGISGGSLNVYALSTNTSGKTITAAGTGKKYPQPTEALTWAGAFYVPVQFASDDLDWDLVLGGQFENRLVAGPTVLLVEVREA